MSSERKNTPPHHPQQPLNPPQSPQRTDTQQKKRCPTIIKTAQLPHNGGFYLYKLNTHKANLLCNNGLQPLNEFLHHAFDHCPHTYFQTGPRGSTLKLKLPTTPVELHGHEVSNLAKWGLKENEDRYTQAHPKVQTFMLENDTKTIAMEVPLWMEHHEHKHYTTLFNTFQPLTGHIDVLRVEDNNVWIWDYKPNARREKHATTQVYLYALMLSTRTGIDLEHFRCGYFDTTHAYVFKPEKHHLQKNDTLTEHSTP